MAEVIQKTCSKKQVLVEVEAVLVPPSDIGFYRTNEELKQLLDRWATDLNRLCGLRVQVRRKYEYQCSECGKPYEVDVDPDGNFDMCAWCGIPLNKEGK